jgi:hypothetical protein
MQNQDEDEGRRGRRREDDEDDEDDDEVDDGVLDPNRIETAHHGGVPDSNDRWNRVLSIPDIGRHGLSSCRFTTMPTNRHGWIDRSHGRTSHPRPASSPFRYP